MHSNVSYFNFNIILINYLMLLKWVFYPVTLYRQFCRRCHVVKVGLQADQWVTFRFVRGIRDSARWFFLGKTYFPFSSSALATLSRIFAILASRVVYVNFLSFSELSRSRFVPLPWSRDWFSPSIRFLRFFLQWSEITSKC